jgi:hypothetical protein
MTRAKKTEAQPTVQCEVVRDFWVTAEDRKRAGTVVELGFEEAFDKIDAGIVKRYKAPEAE